MKEIILSNNKGITLIDDEDYEKVIKYKWYLTKCGYARTKINNKQILLHRFILDLNDKKQHVDHINKNKLDNQKANLRICTNQQNSYNSGKQINNKSGCKGVHWCKEKQKYRSLIYHDGKNKHLGYFDKLESASKAYEEAAKNLHKEFYYKL